MEDQPYTTPDEDPFNVRPYTNQVPVNIVKKRRSSMLDKWILEQQAQSSDTDLPEANPPPLFPSFASSSNPYLAYPELPRQRLNSSRTREDPDAASINSYDLVDDDDIPLNTCEEPSQGAPATPIPPRTHKSSRHSITPSFRTISLGFRSASPSTPPANNMEAASRVLSRLSLFPPRTPRSSTGPSSLADTTITPQHARSYSHSTLSSNVSQQPSRLSSPPAPSKWRPTVLGHFNQPSFSQISIGASETYTTRPSVSSGDTYATSTASRTTTNFDSAFDSASTVPSTPSKLSLFESIRLRGSKSPKSASNFSVASASSVRVSTSASIQDGSGCSNYSRDYIPAHRVPFTPLPGSILDNIDDEDDLDPPPTYRFNKHESTRPNNPSSSSGSLPRVKFSSLSSRTHRKKKKLIISGIGVTEVRKFEGIKRWCESFGEVRQISRMPNGDLQIDFRDAEVADTVCRIRAKVFIAGVGSVQLSWIAGNKR